MNKNKNYRNTFIRITKENVAKVDNAELGVKQGDTVVFEKSQILETLEEWAHRKKDMKYYLIEHDADEDNVHFHIVIEFGKTSQSRFSTLKKQFPYGSIERCKYGVKNCVRYLVHADQPEKYPYSWDEIETNAPAKLESYKIPGRYAMDLKLKLITDKIISGEIREYEIPKLVEPEVYVRYAQKIKNALDYRQRKVLLDTKRSVSVIVLQGKPGVGKSTMARAFAQSKGKSICFSSSSNDCVQDYAGEDILVLDDFDHKAFKIEDFMKLTDPHNNTSIKSRYRNKLFIGDTILIATNIPITSWYLRENQRHRSALFRRITSVLDFGELSSELTVDYSVNSIREYDEIDPINGLTDHIVVLIPESRGTFDLKKYIDAHETEKRKEKIINELKNL